MRYRRNTILLAAAAAAGLLGLSASLDAASAQRDGGAGGSHGGASGSRGGAGSPGGAGMSPGARSSGPSAGQSFSRPSGAPNVSRDRSSGRSFSGTTSGGRQFGYSGDRSGNHRRHAHRRGHGSRIIIGAPYDYYDYGYGYGYSDCDYYRRRALATGSRIWWRRYRECRDDD